ncbi:MAG TPA: aminoglycoside phosphotransferase [Sporichthyaceae bacterium]|jgi:maltokinase
MTPEVMMPWLSGRRWFAGKGRQVSDVTLAASGWLQDNPPVRIEFVTVRYADAEGEEAPQDTYQVPVVYRREPLESLGHALIGQTELAEHGDGPWWVYDALYDKEVTGLWPTGMREDRDTEGMAFRHEPANATPDTPAEANVLSGEQSNTSLVFGDAMILKVFRRLADGPNPDVELHHALAEAGNSRVAALLGWVEGEWPNGQRPHHGTLAIASEFLTSATAGWDAALTSVRDLYAQPDGVSADDAGGDFAGESCRLGEATAEVHADLARMLGDAELDQPARADLAAEMSARLAAACVVVPELDPYRTHMTAVYARLASFTGPLRKQRVHGDLHLGQVMRSATGWRILDFEGEPARPMAARRGMDCPLKDVAGMIRSFDYAARHLLPGAPNTAASRATEWAERNQQAYLEGYARTIGAAPEADPLLAFVLDKACYEVLYEARNRPDWLNVPLSAIEGLLATASPGAHPGGYSS